eukprot:366067-Chlamydomonas_euryale.AAC.13
MPAGALFNASLNVHGLPVVAAAAQGVRTGCSEPGVGALCMNWIQACLTGVAIQMLRNVCQGPSAPDWRGEPDASKRV